MATSNFVSSIAKLKGKNDYDSWKFVVKAYLESEGLWSVVDGTSTEEDEGKKKEQESKARGKIVMLVEPVNYTHIQNAKTAKETWDCLNKAFADTGFARQVSLLRELVNTKLETCNSMDEFLNKIVSCVHKLNGAGLVIPDELVAAFMMAGLTEDYRPMIMGIESTNVKFTSVDIKSKLLQEVLVSSKDIEESAMIARTYQKPMTKGKFKCYECGKEGHMARNCWKRNSDEKKNEENVNLICLSAIQLSNNEEWIIDSGASRPMTNRKDWM